MLYFFISPCIYFFITCSYAINLIALSGAILITLIPFPRHKDWVPPSCNICFKPDNIPNWLAFVAWTYSGKNLVQFIWQQTCTVLSNSLYTILIHLMHILCQYTHQQLEQMQKKLHCNISLRHQQLELLWKFLGSSNCYTCIIYTYTVNK